VDVKPPVACYFIGLSILALYVIVHVTLVLIVHYPEDIADMVFGWTPPYPTFAVIIAALGLVGVVLFHIWATVYTLRNQRRFHVKATAFIEPLMRLVFGHLRSRQHYTKGDISPYYRVNGYPPESERYRGLADQNFADWKLVVGGLVERPLKLSLEDLKALPKQEQITKHNCIQGWSAVAEWRGVPMSVIVELCRPLPQARYVAFHAFMQSEYEPNCYYEVLTLDDMRDPQTILAYEMNWKPLPIPHGAPCRLRIETKVGYKMVKYLRSIEFVDVVAAVGLGYGGYREDHQYYDKVASI
jgi:methionine sulfoxide reductase catalytic subunit